MAFDSNVFLQFDFENSSTRVHRTKRQNCVITDQTLHIHIRLVWLSIDLWNQSFENLKIIAFCANIALFGQMLFTFSSFWNSTLLMISFLYNDSNVEWLMRINANDLRTDLFSARFALKAYLSRFVAKDTLVLKEQQIPPVLLAPIVSGKFFTFNLG